jgi:hypothetical protein
MNKALRRLSILVVIFMAVPAWAQQSQSFGEYSVHYNALNSSLLSPEIANAYGIRRSDSRALINISVLKANEDEPSLAVKAKVVAVGRNLTGQTRNVDMREINEGDGAVYYIGELSVRNMETFDFKVLVTPQGENQAFELRFRQQFYTE